MERDILVQRIQELARMVDESAQAHNINIGAFREAQSLLENFDKEDEEPKEEICCND